MKEVLGRGGNSTWSPREEIWCGYAFLKCRGGLVYCACELKQWQDTAGPPWCPADGNALSCPPALFVIPLCYFMDQRGLSPSSFCY